nr:MAG TPA: hypothetical protein [Caudoviricetes sp.]
MENPPDNTHPGYGCMRCSPCPTDQATPLAPTPQQTPAQPPPDGNILPLSSSSLLSFPLLSPTTHRIPHAAPILLLSP